MLTQSGDALVSTLGPAFQDSDTGSKFLKLVLGHHVQLWDQHLVFDRDVLHRKRRG